MDWNKWKDFWDSNDEKAWNDHEQEYSNAIQESGHNGSCRPEYDRRYRICIGDFR